MLKNKNNIFKILGYENDAKFEIKYILDKKFEDQDLFKFAKIVLNLLDIQGLKHLELEFIAMINKINSDMKLIQNNAIHNIILFDTTLEFFIFQPALGAKSGVSYSELFQAFDKYINSKKQETFITEMVDLINRHEAETKELLTKYGYETQENKETIKD